MSFGYACLHIGSEKTRQKSIRLKNASDENLRRIISSNLDALENILDYNSKNEIALFRISSDIIPFGSHPESSFDWRNEFRERLVQIGEQIKESGARVSMHPGQYTVLNSPSEETAQRAATDLLYHCGFLDSLGCGGSCKIVLHIGGVYSEKKTSAERFIKRYEELEDSIKRRLVIENDDRAYNINDVLDISNRTGIPVVFDNLHHELNKPGEDIGLYEWIGECAKTWGKDDGTQKIHYSQSSRDAKRGAHSQFTRTDEFLAFYSGLGQKTPDIMLEVKDKNLSCVKCSLLAKTDIRVKDLEAEWAKYKYLVLSKSAAVYKQIRQLLKDKDNPDAAVFYRLVESAFNRAQDSGAQINAAQHIWGYFSKSATEDEKKKFLRIIEGYATGNVSLRALKQFLFRLAAKYKQQYLLDSLYFYID